MRGGYNLAWNTTEATKTKKWISTRIRYSGEKDVKKHGIIGIHLVGTPSMSRTMPESTTLMTILEREELIEKTRKELQLQIVAKSHK